MIPDTNTEILDAIKGALREYHHALDTRKHGGIAAHDFVSNVQRILGRPWVQGATLREDWPKPGSEVVIKHDDVYGWVVMSPDLSRMLLTDGTWCEFAPASKPELCWHKVAMGAAETASGLGYTFKPFNDQD